METKYIFGYFFFRSPLLFHHQISNELEPWSNGAVTEMAESGFAGGCSIPDPLLQLFSGFS
jgi:hypothetical protein